MSKVDVTIECFDDAPGRYCIPGVGDGSRMTLCGFVDVPHVIHSAKEHPCNCRDCIAAWKKIQAMRFCDGYFAEW